MNRYDLMHNVELENSNYSREESNVETDISGLIKFTNKICKHFNRQRNF